METKLTNFWNTPTSDLMQSLQTNPKGLNNDEVQKRLSIYGFNRLKPKKKTDIFTLLLAQFKSPIILILILAAILSFFLHDQTDAIIILTIVLISGLLGFWQERGAANAVEKLLEMVQTKTAVLRDDIEQEISTEEAVPGDIVILSAGAIVPGDCAILESKDLFVDEAALTGETFPVEKSAGVLPIDTSLAKRTNTMFMGTHIISGSAKALVITTGLNTEFGKVSEQLKLRPPETDFERGIRRFGYLLMEVTLMLVILIFAFNVYFHRPIVDAFLFSLALAVGLTPQLLPAIISINLSHGAKRMATQQVIVKRLASIENFGSMNVLCSDKTGTLTQGKVQVKSAVDVEGQDHEKVLLFAYLNASFESGFVNPIDEAIRNHQKFDISKYSKLDEIPYDFNRKRLSVLVANDSSNLMTSKGALQNILAVCSQAEASTGEIIEIETVSKKIKQQYEDFSAKGFRTLGIAYKQMDGTHSITKDDEREMIFLGFLLLYDPPKIGIQETIEQINTLGIQLKMITGDNKLVARSVSEQVGIQKPTILTGSELQQMSDEALLRRVQTANVFADVEPNQKERIILALKKAGKVVGYMGDGINDAPALHAADVGISVEGAVDVAKEAADIVLMEMNLNVLVEGVQEGRRTFANTMKYVFMATSANFGNMFSMAGASLFLPFLPLLPKQILLTNLMTDFPEMAIATDNVDQEMIEQPRRWNIKFIRNFMATFGLVSSIFDYLTFGILLLILHATPEQFRTGWFLESVISAVLIVLIVRTRKPFFKSLPGRYLFTATLLIVGFIIILPFTPIALIFGFTRLPGTFLFVIALIVMSLVFTTEIVKYIFYKKIKS